MEITRQTSPLESKNSSSGAAHAPLGDAIRFWERNRVVYNLVLMGVVVGWITLTWPHFRPAMHLFPLFQLIVLGLIANVLYSAAYLVDVPMQSLGIVRHWQLWRWALWGFGTLLAFLLTNYWIADEIYPSVN
jgi:hypothetical protein